MADQFRVELFTVSTEYEEEPLRDRKSQFPNLRRDDAKAEFIRDVIALANTARMFGRPAYLLYGLQNVVDDSPICGVGDSLAPYGTLGRHQAWETCKASIGQAIAEYVTPQVQWELEHSQIGEQEVAYLRIDPLTPPTIFQTRRSIRNQFGADKSWIRFGESKQSTRQQEIAPDDDRYRYAYSQVPYVLPRIWKKYLEGILNNRSPAENVTVAEDIRGYQDLRVVDGRLLPDSVTDFLNSDENLLVIEGAAGSGKSAFVQRWIMTQVRAQLEAVEQMIAREEFAPPAVGWIPAYHRLRNEPVRANYRLDTRLMDAINGRSRGGFWVSRRPLQPEELFRKPDLHWVVCLDGLDEICSQRQQITFLAVLTEFLDAYPSTKVILTTRPDIDIRTLTALGHQVTIAPFDDSQILLYLQNCIGDETYDESVEFLRSDPELWQLCRTPAYLEAVCQRLSNVQVTPLEPVLRATTPQAMPSLEVDDFSVAEEATSTTLPRVNDEALVLDAPVTNIREEPDTLPVGEGDYRPLHIGEILYEMYAYLWQREGSRHAEFGPENASAWWEKTGRLALRMDGLQPRIFECQAKRQLTATGLRHVLSLGILKRDTSLVYFNTNLTKAYFAAAWLRDCLETNDIQRARRVLAPATAAFHDQVRTLLRPLTSKDIQSLFKEVDNEPEPV